MKRILSIITAIMAAAAVCAVAASADEAAVEIGTAADLKAFADAVNGGDTYEGKTVALTSDIDMSAVCGENINGAEASWTPIGAGNPSLLGGSLINPFSGTFDGRGHKITNLYIHDTADCLGLFGGIDGTVKNLAVEGSVSGKECIGGIAGGNQGTIEKCCFSGSVSGVDFVGGIAGMSMGINGTAAVTDCCSSAAVTASGHAAGGICGAAGGADSSVTRCYSVGEIISEGAPDFGGGICAIADGASVADCRYLEGTADRGYYSESGADDVTALSAAQLADRSSFESWDFENVWEMDSSIGRPVLRVMSENDTPPGKYPYEIYDIKLTDERGAAEYTGGVPENTAFAVKCTLKQVSEHTPQPNGDAVIAAAYDADGALTGVSVKRIASSAGLPMKLIFAMQPCDKETVKANVFVWNSLDKMIPLCD